MKPFPTIARSRAIVALNVATGIAVLAVWGWVIFGRGFVRDTPSTRLQSAIAAQMARLDTKPGAALISDQAMRVRAAIERGDDVTATRIITAVRKSSRLENWRYYPFGDFIAGIPDVNDPAFGGRLDAWVAQDPKDDIPLLVRAQFYDEAGWLKRGHNFVAYTQAADLKLFKDYMDKALADVEGAIKLDDRNPYAFYLKLRILRGFGMSPAMIGAFAQAIAKYPSYYPLYDVVLTTLEPRWGGTVAAMNAFVDHYAGGASQYSPLKLLYLSLYRDFLGSAYTSCYNYLNDRTKLSECVKFYMNHVISPQLEGHVLAALQLYDHTDKYQYGLAVGNILFDMLKTPGGTPFSGAILQFAASAMHSDAQLVEDHPGHNNYVVDEAVSESWYIQGFYDNALTKDKEALNDAESTAFPNQRDKDQAIGQIYKYLGGDYYRLGQYPETIAYEKAAAALGSTGSETYICYGYYQLAAYDAAKRACTTVIDETGNLDARYWRAKAYEKSGDPQAALPDLTAVADSEDNFRGVAAIELSVVYDKLNDFSRSLAVLNKYKYLYNSNLTSKDNIAASYNNRCYAYRKLGYLKRALADCTASLQYGSIPDALRKQQELVKRLGAARPDALANGAL